MNIFEDDPLGESVLTAIRKGDTEALMRLLNDNIGLAVVTITRRPCGTQPEYRYPLVGAATDWPGHFPNVSTTIATLVAFGADVNARAQGTHMETPLHGAASSDDVEALDALLDAGADIEASGAVIAGGTALDDAVAFGQWRTAHRLVERGAKTAIWHVAALGLVDRLEEYLESGKPPALYPWGKGAQPPNDDLTVAFWCACHGGQRATAEYLLHRGAELNWVAPWDGLTPLDAARRSEADELARWLSDCGAKSARHLDSL
jgi:uncharacterized protein